MLLTTWSVQSPFTSAPASQSEFLHPGADWDQAHFYTIRMHGTTAEQRPTLSSADACAVWAVLSDTPHQGLMTETSHLQSGPGKSFKSRTRRCGVSSGLIGFASVAGFVPFQHTAYTNDRSSKRKHSKVKTTTCILGS